MINLSQEINVVYTIKKAMFFNNNIYIYVSCELIKICVLRLFPIFRIKLTNKKINKHKKNKEYLHITSTQHFS